MRSEHASQPGPGHRQGESLLPSYSLSLVNYTRRILRNDSDIVPLDLTRSLDRVVRLFFDPIEEAIKVARLQEIGLSTNGYALLCAYAHERNSKSKELRVEAFANQVGVPFSVISAGRDELISTFGVQNLAQAALFAELRGVLPFRVPGYGNVTLDSQVYTRTEEPKWDSLSGGQRRYLENVIAGRVTENVRQRSKFANQLEGMYRVLGVKNVSQAVRLMRDLGALPLISSLRDLLNTDVIVCHPLTIGMVGILKQVHVGSQVSYNPDVERALKRLLGVSSDTYGVEHFVSHITGKRDVRTSQHRRFHNQADALNATLHHVQPRRVAAPEEWKIEIAKKWIDGTPAAVLAQSSPYSIGTTNEALGHVRAYYGVSQKEELRALLVQFNESE